MLTTTNFNEVHFFGNIIKYTKVGKKVVLILSSPDFFHSTKDKKEVDLYQINIFEKDFEKLLTTNDYFDKIIIDLNNDISSENVDILAKVIMTKTYINNKGQTVYPHPEFKFVAIEKHIPATIKSVAIISEIDKINSVF